MSDVMITDGMKQQVITRLATINSATSILSLINGRPAKVTVDEVLTLAERIERWAWRGLLSEQSSLQPSDSSASPRTEKEQNPPAVTSNGNQPHPAPPKPNGHAQNGGGASEKQINAIFAIGRTKGYDANAVKAEIKARIGKDVFHLTSREASNLIDDLKAL